jgi:glycoside hydrolase-like protein/putative peptidoglycan binding protein
MLVLTHRHGRRTISISRAVLIITAAGLLTPLVGSPANAVGASRPGIGSRTVPFHGLAVAVPTQWDVVDLTRTPDACVRFDRPVVYLGHAGDQSQCPSRVIGGAPAVQMEALDARAVDSAAAPVVAVVPGGDVGAVSLPGSGPAVVAVEAAGVLLTATYAPEDVAAMRHVLATATVLPGAEATSSDSAVQGQDITQARLNVPGTFHGRGFDACTAPSQGAMDAWKRLTDYRSIGIYIGGISRGCSQPNLTADWTARQVAEGWHLVPTYVGRQAPCTGFHYRVSYVPAVAFSQGSAEARDAVQSAQPLGIVAPSTIYNDMEGYNSSLPRCVAGVLSYLSGWTQTLHSMGYQSGVYSSASSGMHDPSTHYNSGVYHRPDHIWMAWWNGRADVDGGSYVPDSQWTAHRRNHQYVGNVAENHDGYSINIDRNYLDVSSAVPPPRGCPTNLDFRSYPMVFPGSTGPWVSAAQCLLAAAGYDPGVATGYFGWRTGAAVRAFKASRGLDASDSAIRRWAWTALTSAGPQQFLKMGSTGLRVSKVQRALTARLQYAVPITGYFGPPIRRAVIRYQTLNGMAPTGTVGGPTWAALKTGR